MRVLGVDLGTQSVKVVVCDEALRVVAEAARPIETRHTGDGGAEQDPHAWEAAMGEAIREAVARSQSSASSASSSTSARIDGIAITGQLDGCVAVDGRGEPLHPALIWQDRRATDLGDRVRVWAIAAQVADPSHLAPKVAYLRARLGAVACWHTPTTYLTARLCGAAAIDPALASTTMLYDLATSTWSPELLAMFAISAAALPHIAPAASIAGALHAAGARLAGLPIGTPVAVGTGDDFANVLGAGVTAPGRAVCALGTAEVVGALSATAVRDPDAADPMLETHPLAHQFFVENPGWLSGGAIAWAARLLNVAHAADLDALAAAAPLGAGGVTFVPALAGAMTPRWRPAAAGALHGLRARHDRSHVARAVLEGLAFAARDVVERLAAMSLLTHEVVCTGGGARSATWLQLRADLLGLPHVALAAPDAAPLGAARLALAALAAPEPPPPAIAARYEPAHTAAADRAYRRFREVCATSITLPADG